MRVTKAGGGTPPGVSVVGRWRRLLDLVMARSLLPSPEQCPWSRGTEAKVLEIGKVTGRVGGIGRLAVRPERGCLRRERGWRKGACFKQWGRRDTEPRVWAKKEPMDTDPGIVSMGKGPAGEGRFRMLAGGRD